MHYNFFIIQISSRKLNNIQQLCGFFCLFRFQLLSFSLFWRWTSLGNVHREYIIHRRGNAYLWSCVGPHIAQFWGVIDGGVGGLVGLEIVWGGMANKFHILHFSGKILFGPYKKNDFMRQVTKRDILWKFHYSVPSVVRRLGNYGLFKFWLCQKWFINIML